MNQDLSYELNAVMGEAQQTGLFSSLCTIQQRTNTVDALGQVDLTDWVNVAGCVNIPCQMSRLMLMRPNIGAHIRTPQQFDTLGNKWLLLNDYYPQILQQHTAVVDGVRYEIMAVEPDSQKQETTLAVRTYTL